MPFSFQSERISNCQIFHFDGSFIENDGNRALVDEFMLEIENGQKDFIFDLEKLEYVNSSGINALVKMVKKVNQNEANLVFVAVPDKIHELLKIIKLNSVLTIRESIEEGVDALKAEE